jgi:thymidylate synthase ThyX
MTIEAKMIADSVSDEGARLTTFALRYPRFIHAEFMTHRMFSRNASSSRAIPVDKIISQIEHGPSMPVYWGKNQKGMQARAELNHDDAVRAQEIWLAARDKAVEHARQLVDLGVHKQLANRILEPWSHISVVVTATEWANFFMLRCHPDAQPEIRVLAEQMRDIYYSNIPREMGLEDWHLPFISEKERAEYTKNDIIKASVARCARVSYLTHDNELPKLENDVRLHDTLASSRHMSPFEHQGFPMSNPWGRNGNFVGWWQYRKSLPGEVYKKYEM